MKYRNQIAAACASLLLLGVSAVSAQPAYSGTPRIDQRQAQQQQRIVRGARSGELTRHETRRLEHQQANIRRMERRARADGVVTRSERREIRRAQQRASRSIANQKHDRQRY